MDVTLSQYEKEKLDKYGTVRLSIYTTAKIAELEKEFIERRDSINDSYIELEKLEERYRAGSLNEDEKMEMFTLDTGISYDVRNCTKIEDELIYAKAHCID